MLAKILNTLRKAFLDSESAKILQHDTGTALIGHELGLSGVGYVVFDVPEGPGHLLEFTTNMPLSATVEAFSSPTITAETGVEYPLRDRYLGSPLNDAFCMVLKDPTVTDEGVVVAPAIKYGDKGKVGAETNTSWVFIPGGAVIMLKYTSHAAANNIVTRVNAKLVPNNLIR